MTEEWEEYFSIQTETRSDFAGDTEVYILVNKITGKPFKDPVTKRTWDSLFHGVAITTAKRLTKKIINEEIDKILLVKP